MKVIKKNQIILFVGALMLVVAGYLSLSKTSQDISNLIPTSVVADTEEMAALGDAKLVNANAVTENTITNTENENTVTNEGIEEENIKQNTIETGSTVEENSTKSKDSTENEDYFTKSRLERDTMYSQTLETYENMINNDNISENQKSIAQQEITKINNQKNAIMIAENLIKVKGFEDLIIFVNNENVSVIIKADKLEEKDVAQIQNIITRELEVSAENITISNK